MRGLSLLSLTILLSLAIVFADYEQDLDNPELAQQVQDSKEEVTEHHRTKRYVDPIIPALLLGKSAFLLGSILGPKLLSRPQQKVIYRPVHVHHSSGGWGGWGGWSGGSSGGGWGGWSSGGQSSSRGWGWN